MTYEIETSSNYSRKKCSRTKRSIDDRLDIIFWNHYDSVLRQFLEKINIYKNYSTECQSICYVINGLIYRANYTFLLTSMNYAIKLNSIVECIWPDSQSNDILSHLKGEVSTIDDFISTFSLNEFHQILGLCN